MELLQELDALWFALIGWAATALLLWQREGVSFNRRREQTWLCGMLWLAVALIGLVRIGALAVQVAMFAGFGIAIVTLVMAIMPLPLRRSRR